MNSDWTLEERPKRHRGAYNKDLDDIPFELSRSKVEAFAKCIKCFQLEKSYNVKPPSIPSFLINTNTDTLLKKDHDQWDSNATTADSANIAKKHDKRENE